MGTEARPQFTVILGRAQAGDERAKGELIALIYDELRRVASRLMRRERTDHTLSPTAVVHEAVIRLLGDAVFDKATDRSFLFASAARAIREVLIDHARRREILRRADRFRGRRGVGSLDCHGRKGLAARAGLARRPTPSGERMTPEHGRQLDSSYDAAIVR